MTINFFVQSKKNPAPIYVRLRGSNNLDAKARTKWVIDNDDWSKKKGQPKNLRIDSFKILKSNLDNFSTKLGNRLNSLKDGEVVNSKWLKEYINPTDKSEIPNRLVSYIDFYIKAKEEEISTRSTQKYQTIRRKIERMESHNKRLIFIKNVDENFKIDFIKFYDKEGYSNNTKHRELAFIKTFCRHARYNGVETSYQLDNLTLKKEKVVKIYLTFKEISIIQNKKLNSEAYSNARDWLIISCYTGQRVSDFMRFRSDMIRIEKGKKLIEFTQKKTGKDMGLPLHSEVIEILDKNNGEFPYKISDQRYNEYIKEVCRLSGISQEINGSKQQETYPKSKIYRKINGLYPKHELITSHIGRRSFATNFYGIIPTPLLMSATGHSTESMFLLYIGKTDTQKAMALADYF